ncbi:hypothetical protein LIA77_00167 [Sarocladium implicatum]|nr:hypothetical protein LIA77_00167 [Sarocladium implicatum]
MGIPSKAQLSSAFQSKDSFLEFIRVPDAPAGQTTVGKGRWSNRDLEPTPMEEYYAANLLSVCFRCMFGSAWEDWANTLPASAATSSKQILCFFLIWFVEAPLVFVHPNKIHWLYSLQGVILPISTLGLFGWCMANGAGFESLKLANEMGEAAKATTSLGWAIMNGINVILGTLSPMLVNQPDLARYCKNTRDAGWVQGLALFCSKLLVFFLGLAATVSIQGVWGVAYWNVWDLLDAILDHYWTAAARTAVWLVSMTFILSCIGTNLGANSLPFGADIATFAPRYISIVRGQVICAILSIVVQPWQLLVNAAKFLTFLGSYNIYMAPICSVWMVDYLFVRKGNLHTPSLYDGRKGSLYWFWSGVNWLGVVAWACGMVTGLPGLVGALQPGSVSQAAIDLYKMGWLLSFFTAGTIYFILRLLVPVRIHPPAYESMPVSFEFMAKNGREGFFDGEREEGIAVSTNGSDIETADAVTTKTEKTSDEK